MTSWMVVLGLMTSWSFGRRGMIVVMRVVIVVVSVVFVGLLFATFLER